MEAQYKIHEFAELSGVTVKALLHYDRLGLLKPKRNSSRYRIYAERDLERLEQIVALKFVGLPLKQIKDLLNRDTMELKDALRFQRQVLLEKQQLLARAINAIAEAEGHIERDKPADPAVLKKLIQVIGLQQNIDARKYFSEEGQAKFKKLYEFMKASDDYKSFQQDVVSSLADGPASEKGQALAIRFRELMKRDENFFREVFEDPDVLAGLKTAGADMKSWPPALIQRLEKSNVRKSHEFIMQAMAAAQKDE